MSGRFSRPASLLLSAVLLLFPVHAADESAAITAGDPAVTIEALGLRLDPLPQDQLATEAEAWRALLQERATAVAEAEIVTRDADNPKREDMLRSLPALREQKDALLERFELVLDAYDAKGGDSGPYRKYAAAVSGIKSDPSDVGATVSAFTGWLTEKEGGIKWAVRTGQFLGIMVIFWIIAGLIGKLVGSVLDRSQGITGLLKQFIRKWSRRLIVLVGLLVALGTVGVNVGAAVALIGGGAFIMAFALQDTLGNLANGIMLMVNRPFDVGDAVEVGGVTGKVEGVSLVSTTILTFDNRKVVVPNKQVWGQVITNITGMPTRRVDLVFGIGYDDDIEQAQGILERIVAAHPLVLDDPEPKIALNELADSSVNFICRPWTNTSDYLTVLSDITRQVKLEFDKAGVSIPYPQRDIHLYPAAALEVNQPS